MVKNRKQVGHSDGRTVKVTSDGMPAKNCYLHGVTDLATQDDFHWLINRSYIINYVFYIQNIVISDRWGIKS